MKLLGDDDDFQLLHLLFTSLVIAIAVIYWWSKGGDTERRRTEEDTSPGSVCDPNEETAEVQSTEVPQNQLMESSKETERFQWLENSAKKLEESMKKKKQVGVKLTQSVMDLEDGFKEQKDSLKELIDSLKMMVDSAERLKDSVKEKLEKSVKELHSSMKQVVDIVDELKEFLLHKDPELLHNIFEIKALVDELEPEEIFAQLESEKKSLSDKLQTLRDALQEMGRMRCEINKEWNEIMKTFESEEEAYSILMKMRNDMKKTSMEFLSSQEVSVDEVAQKQKAAEEMIALLESEHCDLSEEDTRLSGEHGEPTVEDC